jgi:hypothetical protein
MISTGSSRNILDTNEYALRYLVTRRVPTLSPAPEERIRGLEDEIASSTWFCVCGLSMKWHVGAPDVERILSSHVESGLLKRREWAGEPLFSSCGNTDDPTRLMEVIADIEFSVGVLAEVFPEYRRGVHLRDQSETGTYIRRTARTAMDILRELEVVPKYWEGVRFNITAVMLALRKVFETAPAVRAYLRLVERYPKDQVSMAVAMTMKRDPGNVSRLVQIQNAFGAAVQKARIQHFVAGQSVFGADENGTIVELRSPQRPDKHAE